MAIKVLHFADAHIDMANFGKRNPDTGLPFRVEDFLKALDTIIDAAIARNVDLVVFAGDAYKDRTPVPTFQREWGKRIMRLSRAEIPTLLLVGNHDMSPAQGRAHTLQEFDTLAIPFIKVISQPCLLTPDDLWGKQVQVIGLPWISKSRVQTSQKNANEGGNDEDLDAEIGSGINQLMDVLLNRADPEIPLVFTAHASVQGAKYGRERSVMLGKDLVISKSIVCDPRIDYSALGHIHKPQNLNEGYHPPAIYPGSIERVDFGEAEDEKYFIVAEVTKGNTTLEWVPLIGRTFIDRFVRLAPDDINVTQKMINALPPMDVMKDAVVRLVVHYPEGMETQIDESALLHAVIDCFEFKLVKRPQLEARNRLGVNQQLGSYTPLELLDLYFKTKSLPADNAESLLRLAKEMIESEDLG